MLYTVNLNEEMYIMSLSHTVNDNIDLDVSVMDMQHLEAYKLIDGVAILDEEKLQQMIAAEERKAKDTEITELKRYLNETDYIMAETFESVMALNNPVTFIADFIKILVDFKQQYSEALANRKLWRQRIKELEG